MACTCVRCPECHGRGSVWFSFSGEYLGDHRCDDFDEMEPCEECGGSGVIKTCDECIDARDEEFEQNDERPY